jgi:carbamate kinase
MSKLAVIALGGNALLRDGQEGTIDQQEQNTYESLENIVFLIKEGYNIIITHGNGPQVGNILLRNDAGNSIYGIPHMPLDICVADSQGGIGYMIERILKNVLRDHKIQRNILTLITMVEVDSTDSAFQNPKKRIGRSFSQAEKDKLVIDKGWTFKDEPKHKDTYRRVVPSPLPKQIINWEVIGQNAKNGVIVIAVGGGGVPVYFDEKGHVRPSEAVVDKDLASAILASHVEADEFYILTDVPYVYANYGKENQEILEFLDYKDTMKLLKEGVFSEGDMSPKITAALQFIKRGGKKSIITESNKLMDKKFGTKITLEYDEKDRHKYDDNPRQELLG